MRRFRSLWIAAVCGSLLLPALAAAGTAFSFRNGVTWDTTPEQVLAAEGSTKDDGTYNYGEANGLGNYYFKANNAYYVFRGDLLVTAYALAPGSYADTASGLTALYGAPADVSTDTVASLINQLSPNSSFSDLTAWQLSDGTIAALLTVGGEAYVVYFNVQRITGGG